MENFFSLIVVCFKVGALTIGGAAGLFPVLAHELVEVGRWLTMEEFLQALALGKITPGPVILGMSLAGVKSAGVLGGLAVAAAIIAPSLAWMWLATHINHRFQESFWVSAFFRGVRPAIPGLLLALATNLFFLNEAYGRSIGLVLLTLWLLLRWRVPPVLLLLSALLIGQWIP